MGRRDIASLLCVAHETVSRSFTNLAEAVYVSIRRKEVELLDIEGLHAFSLFTRGTAPDAGGADPAARRASMAWLARLEKRLPPPPIAGAPADLHQVAVAASRHTLAAS
jgi:hypothetical protein